MDYYEILDIEKSASSSDIKKAFHKKALQFHPDKNNDKEWAGEEYKKVKKAYDILSNEEKKMRYDMYGENDDDDVDISDIDINNIFDTLFKDFPMGNRQSSGGMSFAFESFPKDVMGTVFGDIPPETMNVFGNLGNLSSMGDINVFMDQFKGGFNKERVRSEDKRQTKKIVEEFEIELPMSLVYDGKMTKIPYNGNIIEIPSWKTRWETPDGNYTFKTVRDGKSFERMGNILIVHKKVKIDYLLEGKENISVIFPNDDKIRVNTGWDIALKNGKEMKMRIIVSGYGFWDDDRKERDDAHVLISVGIDKRKSQRSENKKMK